MYTRQDWLKAAVAFFICLLLLCIFLLGMNRIEHKLMNGSIDHVQIIETKSDLYSQEEIQEVIELVLERFENGNTWGGCTLLTVSYGGDKQSLKEKESALEYFQQDAFDEYLVLVISFKTGSRVPPGLAENSVYKDFEQLYARNDGTKWEFVDGGYG